MINQKPIRTVFLFSFLLFISGCSRTGYVADDHDFQTKDIAYDTKNEIDDANTESLADIKLDDRITDSIDLIPADISADSASCSDHILNGDEIGIDCGGSCPPCSTLCTTQSEIPIVECEILATFYHSTYGDSWTDDSGWLVTNTPCSWTGVICSGSHVIEIDMNHNNVAGSLPPELGSLSRLTQIILYGNRISGNIPTEIGNLNNLQFLRLDANSLNGSIPKTIGDLQNLIHLDLSGNSLSGAIPPELGNLSAVDFFDISDNNLSGSIPSELSQLISAQHLDLGLNSLSGAIPPELGNLPSIQTLTLSFNSLSGVIPPEIGNLSSIKQLFIVNNNLSGTIPSEIGNLSSLNTLRLDVNQLSGEIPVEIMSLNLSSLALDGNQCFTAGSTALSDWLTALDPLWDDGC